jgi:AraC-like DNA-binding protein
MSEAHKQPFVPAIAAHQKVRIEKAMAYLQKHFRDAPRLREVAKAAHFSPYHFHRIFRQYFGKTFKMAATELQIAEAKRLLLEGKSVVEVSRALSFASHASFTNRFKRCVGASPNQWMRIQRMKMSRES